MAGPRAAWIALGLAVLVWTRVPAALQIGGEDREEALVAFHERIDAYAALHRKFEEGLPPRGTERTAFGTLLARRYLAAAIRTARWQARQGDIFTPAAARAFEGIIRNAYATADGAQLADIFRDRAARPIPSPLVNGPYEKALVQVVPDAILRLLPELAEDVEYRTVNADLVLWDMHAEIIVDVLPDAFLVE
jgi:hypothetical protein